MPSTGRFWASREPVPRHPGLERGAVSSGAVVRARAAQIVAQVAFQGRSLDRMLAAERPATAQARGLLRSLCYDSLRWYIRLDAILARLLTRGAPPSPEIRALAVVGLCQLEYTDIATHAAVAETVNAARVLRQPRAAGLINAVLRRYLRERAELARRTDGDLAVRTAHPRWLVDALRTDWSGQLERILAANNDRPPFWLRVNRRRGAPEAYRRELEQAGHAVSASLFGGEALRLERPCDVAELPGFAQGRVSVQDPAAQLAAHLLAPRAGERVLDACAAPGGKTGHLLELQPSLAELVAVDVSASRLQRVAENLRRLGLEARLVQGDAAQPGAWWDGRRFDRVLLDVPCSATGVIRRHPDVKLLRRADDIPALAVRQAELLEALWPLLAPGGRLVYASCSALRAETSDVVEAFLRRHPEAADVTADALAQSGAPAAELAALRDEGIDAGVGLRIAAGTAAMDGFYYACLQQRTG